MVVLQWFSLVVLSDGFYFPGLSDGFTHIWRLRALDVRLHVVAQIVLSDEAPPTHLALKLLHVLVLVLKQKHRG